MNGDQNAATWMAVERAKPIGAQCPSGRVAFRASRNALSATPIHRVTARVLPVSSTGAVLLLQERDPARPGELYWSSIGGAVDSGESLPEAAVRELWEETGIVVGADLLTAPVHRGVQAYSWDGVDNVADSTYFVVPLDDHVEVNFDHLEPEEVGNVLAAGWWTPAALAGVAFRPPDLPEIMSTALTAYADRPR